MGETRIARPARHRELNDSAARAYGQILREHVKQIDSSPVPAAAVFIAAAKMHDVARDTFPAAFLQGKTQAIGELASLNVHDNIWLDRKLSSNYHFLSNSFAPDAIGKINRLRLDIPGPRRNHLDQSFGARIENLYGGILWTVHEAGFRSGVDEIRYLLTADMPTLYQDDGVDLAEVTDRSTAGKKKTDKDRWALLALLLGFGRDGADDLRQQALSLAIGVEYITQHDPKVCGSCEDAEGVYYAPAVCPAPGEVCVPGDTLVTSPQIFESHRRRYSGPMVSIVTVRGRNLTCTPNHPVLTRRGWVEAGKLIEGDDLICGTLGERVAIGDPYVHERPTRIDQIHNSLLERFTTKRERLVSMDLDPEAANGKVEIVSTGRNLGSNLQTSFSEHSGQLALSRSYMSASLLGAGDFAQSHRAMVLAAPSLVGSLNLGGAISGTHSREDQDRPLLGATHNTETPESIDDHLSGDPEVGGDVNSGVALHISGTQRFNVAGAEAPSDIRENLGECGVAVATRSDARSKQAIPDDAAGYAEFLSQAQFGYARDISLDEIAKISVEPFDGHVYNLATETHWYIADGIIVHNCDGYGNCRCYLQIVVSKEDNQ